MSRRTQVLESALHLLAESGTRGLTHRAVDARGGLPAGTASNHFRSRDALLAGVLEHIGQREAEMVAALDDAPGPRTVDELVAEIAGLLDVLLGSGRSQTIARHAIFLEAAWQPALQAALLAATVPFWTALSVRLSALGAPSPDAAARVLLACIDGLVLDQLLRPDDEFDAATALRPVVAGICEGPPARPAPPGAARLQPVQRP